MYKWTVQGDYKADYSYWPDMMKKAAIDLVKDEGAWQYSHVTDQFINGEDLEVIPNILRFKVVSNVAFEWLIKALCVKREIDIFKPKNKHVTYDSPYSVIPIACENNEWLKSKFKELSYVRLSDINTVTLQECIEMLKLSLITDNPDGCVEISNLLDKVDKWRKLHRNTECHLHLNLVMVSDYEDNLRSILNNIIKIYNESEN